MFPAPPGFERVRLLGRGSCFEVARVERGRKPCIAKRPAAGAASQGKAVTPSPLERERVALEALDDRRLPRVLAAGEDASGPWLVETLMPGPSLRGAMASATAALDRPAIARDLVEVVRALHSTPGALVHADISPDNVLVAGRASAGLIDFSAAGWRDVDALGRGTLPYVAPELCRGEVSPTQATDRYALAILVAELLSNAPPCPAIGEAARLVAIGENGHDVEGMLAASVAPRAVSSAILELARFAPADRSGSLERLASALDDWVDAARIRS